MNKIFNMKNLYTILYIFSIYLIFILLFEDILKGKEFSVELKKTPLIIVSILFFTWTSRVFINSTIYNLPKIKIVIILCSSIFFSLLLQKFIYINKPFGFQTEKFQNPLYDKFVKIADYNNLNLSFTKEAWVQRGPNNYKINTIFEEKAKSIDILFFGDSSIAWGMIPKVIEQMTGKKVAVYAYESNVLTVKTSKLFNKVSQYYLKDNGLVIFSFDNWTQDKEPNNVIISKKQCDEIISWKDDDFKKYAKKQERKQERKSIKPIKKQEKFYHKYLSFNAFQSLYKQKSEYLKSEYGLFLKSPSFYEEYLEVVINPKLYKNKNKNKNKKTKFIRWDLDSITQYNPNFTYKSIYSKVMPTEPIVNKNIELNARAASKIYGKNKIYMVPLYYKEKKYVKSRNNYYSYYKQLGFGLSDLGAFQPKKHAYTMQSGCHMGNTGGLMKSILIGKWLQEYFNDSSKTNLNYKYNSND